MTPPGAPAKWPRIRLPAKRRADFTSAQWKAIKRAEHQVRLLGPVCDRCGGEHDTKACREPIAFSFGEHWGPAKWAELHLWALGFTGTPMQGWRWLARWLKGIRACGGCRKHARQWVRANPPDWSDPFAWSAAFHNEVSVGRCKPAKAPMSVEAARAMWVSRG